MMYALFLTVLFLAFSNGANDNFKGVATLFGSRTVDYRWALGWATLTTLGGSLASVFLAGELIQAFSGKGLVPDALVGNPSFLLAVGLGAAITVMLATVIGMPISTTHSLTGALVGAGLVANGWIHLGRLGESFFLPLAISPFLSFALTAVLYPAFRKARLAMGVEREMCVCLEEGAVESVQVQPDGTMLSTATGMAVTVGQQDWCEEQYRGHVMGFDAQRILDGFHFLSAGMVGFARGLNDTPKIVALMAVGVGLGFSLPLSMVFVGLAMAIGGLLSARKVAATMSGRIVDMNHGQGFTANLVTAFLVMVASRFGVPVSTTHVSCGSLFGLGAVTGTGRWRMIRTILLAWVVTLPMAAFWAAGVAFFVY